jgi:hypothetical protein
VVCSRLGKLQGDVSANAGFAWDSSLLGIIARFVDVLVRCEMKGKVRENWGRKSYL